MIKTSGQSVLDLFEKVAGFFRAQIQKENRRTGLLEHGIQPIGHAHVANLRQRAMNRLDRAGPGPRPANRGCRWGEDSCGCDLLFEPHKRQQDMKRRAL